MVTTQNAASMSILKCSRCSTCAQDGDVPSAPSYKMSKIQKRKVHLSWLVSVIDYYVHDERMIVVEDENGGSCRNQ